MVELQFIINYIIDNFYFIIYMYFLIIAAMYIFEKQLHLLYRLEPILGKTAIRWFNFKIIRVCLFLSFLVFITGLYLSIKYSVLNTSLEFLITFFAVFIGMIFSFFWNEAHIRIQTNKENTQILYLIIKELYTNGSKLVYLYKDDKSYLPYLMQTSVWDLYKTNLSRFTDWNVNALTSIYHKIYVINENIKKYPLKTDYDKFPDTLSMLEKMIYETEDEIIAWTDVIIKYFNKYKIGL